MLISLVFTPIYIHLLGIEAFGLIGFYTVLQSVIQILDFGLSPTMNREMARYSTMPEKAEEARNFVRTLEVWYWVLGILVGCILIALAPLISVYWIKASFITSNDLLVALIAMGGLVALQWPNSLYQSGLMGLQKQALLNGTSILISTISNVSTALILWLVSKSIIVYFAWPIVVNLAQVFWVRYLLWRNLPASDQRPRVSVDLVLKTWRFAAGMTGISLTAIALMQLDKVILSKILSLEMFGYYILAATVARVLYIVITPLFNGLFPRFSAMVNEKNEEGLNRLYHTGSQYMAVLVFPLAGLVALFSYEILAVWIGNPETALHAAPITSILVMGTALNGMMNLPYALQLAYGWVRLGLYINTCFIITLVPAVFYMSTHYGGVGAAWVWFTLNGIYVLVGIPLTHKKLLRGEAGPWFKQDVLGPLLVTSLVMGFGKFLFPHPTSSLATISWLVVLLAVAFFGSAMSVHHVRKWLSAQLSKVAPV